MCNDDCPFIKDFIREYSDPLYVEVGDFEEYFNSLDKKTRGEYHKAVKNGLILKDIEEVTDEIYDSIMEVYTSKEERQGRLINTLYHLITGGSHDLREGWPHLNYKAKCKKHYFKLKGCYLGDKLVGFLELLHSEKLDTVYSFMGHADYLKLGVAKFILIEAIKSGKIRYLHYGNSTYIPSMIAFLKDLHITNTNPEFVYQLANDTT